ncbi:electron transport complex subunit E [Teredinibacter turnerae]|uniref:electron transport complex subunit E n=1 Tax=Teredinibacter turnerae TaxID=2426 RepID=UPI000363CE53|nr:electron transport complex subunit E [Teredinibacter turnerae]
MNQELSEQSSDSHDDCSSCASTNGEAVKRYRDYFSFGIWENNIALVQLLGLCPVMAVTTSATNGLGMGIATTAVLIISSVLVSALRHTIPAQVRNPVMIAIIAGTVTLVDLAMNAWMHELYKVLGLFIALIVTNCAILGRTEAFAMKQPPMAALADGVGMGLGFTWALVLLGGAREILGSGTLFAHASSLLGSHFEWLEITFVEVDSGVLLAILPPGGFIVLGIMIALKRVVDERIAAAGKPDEGGDLVAIQP